MKNTKDTVLKGERRRIIQQLRDEVRADILDEEIERFLETPAMKRLLDAENYLMVTGRLPGYSGKTVREELLSIFNSKIQKK